MRHNCLYSATQHEDEELKDEANDKWDLDEPKIITREEKSKSKASAASKRGFYKKTLKRSSATDDIDSISKSNE